MRGISACLAKIVIKNTAVVVFVDWHLGTSEVGGVEAKATQAAVIAKSVGQSVRETLLPSRARSAARLQEAKKDTVAFACSTADLPSRVDDHSART